MTAGWMMAGTPGFLRPMQARWRAAQPVSERALILAWTRGSSNKRAAMVIALEGLHHQRGISEGVRRGRICTTVQ